MSAEAEGQVMTVDRLEEATVAAFLYDALLTGKSSDHDVQTTAAEYPAAADIAEVHARDHLQASAPLERTTSQKQRVTVSKISVLPLSMQGARCLSLLARILVLVLALLACGAIITGLMLGEGESPADRVLQILFQIDESNIGELASAASTEALEWRQVVARTLLDIEDMVVNSRASAIVPEQYFLVANLAFFFVAGTLGGLVIVHVFILAGYIAGFALGVTTAVIANGGLALVGGVRCEVTRSQIVTRQQRVAVMLAPELQYPTR